jgi:uncharacterized membrane protein YfcA
MLTDLFTALAIVTLGFIAFWIASIIRGKKWRESGLGPIDIGIGFVTNFLDTLGIGSFATTTSMFRLGKLVPDEQIPGTMNVGHTLPSILEAFIYIAVVQVDVVTLIAMIAASVVGAWLGAGLVSRLPRRTIQIGMGIALIATAGLMLMSQLNVLGVGGELLGLTGTKLLLAVVANMVLGALMTLGIGLFAPCMVLIYFMGMNLKTAFPVMMGSCAFLMPVGSIRFIREGKYHLRAALGLAIGGIPGVLLAAYIVKSLPLYWVKWLVVVVVLYTAITLLRSAFVERSKPVLTPSPAATD